jgi:hypothetical protein
MYVKSSFKLSVLVAAALLPALCGCNKNSGAEPAKTVEKQKQKVGPAKSDGKAPPPPHIALQLLPADALGYIRIAHVARVRNEFIRPTHVKDAAKIQRQVNGLIQQFVLSFGQKGGSLGIKGETLLQLFFELETIHLGAWTTDRASSPADANLIAVLEFATRSGVDALLKDVKPKLSTRNIAGADVQLLPVSGTTKTALYRPDPKTLVLGTEQSVEAALRRCRTDGQKSLADSPRFQQVRRDWSTGGELFAYLNLQAARTAMPKLPFPTVAHLGASLRLDGGLAMRAYADETKPFPKFLVRTPREKKFLSRIPADAVFLVSAVTGGAQARTNFFEWVTQELGRNDNAAKSLLPQSWRQFAENVVFRSAKERRRPDRKETIEAQAFAFIEDLWLAVLPVKSESAFFIAPYKAGRFGAAFLFDVDDREEMRKLAERLFEMGNRAKLPWKETVHDGLTIRYVDFAEVAKAAGRTIPPEIAKRFDLQVGYAEGKELFFVGTFEAIKFAHKPAGKTIDRELTYDNVDSQNAIMLSLRPGRVLHRTFGVPQVDSVLKRLAAQIPEDSNYAVTLNFKPTQLTFRTNIPFVSLVAWLVTEWQGAPGNAR